MEACEIYQTNMVTNNSRNTWTISRKKNHKRHKKNTQAKINIYIPGQNSQHIFYKSHKLQNPDDK